MKYRLKVQNIWQQGPREKQEDSIYPEYGKAKETDRLFILCDGMGGHSAGEVASKTVCTAMSESVFKNSQDAEGVFTDEHFKAALSDAFDLLDTKDDGAEKKMGTTLTFLKLHADGCTIAHMGDSRVYHIRPGKGVDDTLILFQTIDHSLVNDLVKIGELTPDEAKVFKQRNVITRAMQPCMERRPKADIYHTHDIKPGDYFMLCSDGILEQMEDDNIKYIFSEKGGDIDNKVDMLIKITDHNHDNHSAILLLITDVIDPIVVDTSNKNETIKKPELLMAQVDEEADEKMNDISHKEQEKLEKKEVKRQSVLRLIKEQKSLVKIDERDSPFSVLYHIRFIVVVLILLLFSLVCYVGCRYLTKQDNSKIEQNVYPPHKPIAPQNSRPPINVHNSEETLNTDQVSNTNVNVNGTSANVIDVYPIIPEVSNESIPCSDSEIINDFQNNN